MTPTGPTYPFNVYQRPGGQFQHGVTYIYDPDLIVYNTHTNVATNTGGLRPLYSTDLVFTADSVQISGINVNTDQLEVIETSGVQYLASISGQKSSYSTVSNSTVSGSMSVFTTGLALPSTSTRKEAYIQVVGSGSPLYLAFNTTVASQANFNVILKAASSDFGTDGGVWTSERYTGPVSVSGFIGCRFSAWQNAN